jgi:DNA-binding NarL/FixJ family response regulator
VCRRPSHSPPIAVTPHVDAISLRAFAAGEPGGRFARSRIDDDVRRRTIRVLLVDDHPTVRAGLESVLGAEPDVDVVGVAADGAEAIELAVRLTPDVVLMDLAMPRVDGIEATRQLAGVCPDVRVLALTSFADRERILAALDAGAIGYLLKDTDPEELLAAVRAADRGDATLAQPAMNAIVAARSEAVHRHSLTDREREVLALVAHGYTNSRIALRLGITEKTVKTHLTRVFATLGVTDRTQAALYARRAGLA